MMHLLCKFSSEILKMETGTKELENDFLLRPLTFKLMCATMIKHQYFFDT
jgi:hypothetical protein